MSYRMRLQVSLCAFILSCAASPAFAVDGVVLIDQARALSGSVTPGDAPGFPILINQPGSYRLSGNLNVPADVAGIVITTSGVTLDLNGFQVAGSGNGTGITSAFAHRGISVRNGTVRGFGIGIDLNGLGAEIHGVRVLNNTLNGIEAGAAAIVTGNTVLSNGGVGIQVGEAAVVTGNITAFNADLGLRLQQFSILRDHVASQNGGVGIEVACPSTIIGNAALANSGINLVGVGENCVFAGNNAPTP